MKKYFLLVLIVITISSTTSISQQIIKEPVIEVLDLNVDGTSGVFVNISKNFDYIQRIIFHLDFVDNTFDWNVFAGESSALTNGINLYLIIKILPKMMNLGTLLLMLMH
jgi:hypothetical protein